MVPIVRLLGVALRVGKDRFVRGLHRFSQGRGQVRLAISRSLKLVVISLARFSTHKPAGHFATKVPAHAIGDRHQQPALLNLHRSRLPILRNTAAMSRARTRWLS